MWLFCMHIFQVIYYGHDILWQARLEQRLALLRRRRLEDARQGKMDRRQAHLHPEPAYAAGWCLAHA
jgi:hypothetical protein